MSDMLPHTIWLSYFLENQGYIIKDNILYQDNQSAIKLDKNGRNSCTGNSRHIAIRYFFVKDQVDKGEVKIEYCPKEYMLADYFTKPLQGKVFRIFPRVIMGYETISWLKQQLLTSKERVGNNKIDVNGKSENQYYGKNMNRKMTYADAARQKRVNNLCNRKNVVLTNLN